MQQVAKSISFYLIRNDSTADIRHPKKQAKNVGYSSVELKKEVWRAD